jgi:serine protease
VVDTRNPTGTFGGPPIGGNSSRSFPLSLSGNPCNIPSTVIAYSLNVTVVPETTLGYLTIWPTGEGQPTVSTLNSPDGRIKANAAIVPGGTPSGSVSVYVTDTTNVILDIDGYFATPTQDSLQFYTLTPCRIVDTRNNQDGGTLLAGVERDYLIAGACGIPSEAAAYSFNVTVLPAAGGLDYLTVWPKGETQPVVSTLNDKTGTVVANAAIVPAGSQNATAFYAHSNSTNLLLDVNGYFAAPGAGGLSLYPLTPCRVLDTRHVGNGQPFMGDWNPPNGVDVLTSQCAPPSTAEAFVFNATVVPPGRMPYLTLWPNGELQPTVSTLNALDGFITSNMAIVGTSNGSIDAYAAGLTQLILDISGYFAP